jgi:hypothetical protein
MGKLSAELERERRSASPNPWSGSPFEWLRNEAPARKGALGKEMFKRWATSVGFQVAAPPPRSHCDCVVGGLKIVVKFGLQWANGTLVFEQIRHGEYAAGALLGLEPQHVHLWLVPLDVLWHGSDEQHGAETHWLRFRPERAPAILAPYGGTLAGARAALLEQAGDNVVT